MKKPTLEATYPMPEPKDLRIPAEPRDLIRAMLRGDGVETREALPFDQRKAKDAMGKPPRKPTR